MIRLSATAYIGFAVTVLAVALVLWPVYLILGILLRVLFGKSCPSWIVTASALLLAVLMVVYQVGGQVFYSLNFALGAFALTVSCIFAYVFVWAGFGVAEALLNRDAKPADKSANKTSYWILLVIITAGLISAFVFWGQNRGLVRGQSPPPINASLVSKVVFTQYSMARGREERAPVVEKDNNNLAVLLDVISEGRSQQDHKCASIAEMEVFYGDTERESEVIEILSDHGSDYYEVRFRGDNYKISKTAFLKALDHCGFNMAE